MYVNCLSGQVHRTQISGCWGWRGEGSYYFMRTEFLFGVTKAFWKYVYSGGGCTSRQWDSVALNWTLKVMDFMLPMFYHHFLNFSGSSRTLLCVTHICVLRDESPGQGLPADLLGAEALWGQSLSPAWGPETAGSPHLGL